jgi:hypothetical protein
MTIAKTRVLFVGAGSVLAAGVAIVLLAMSSCGCRRSNPIAGPATRAQIASKSVGAVPAKSATVPCALTHDAGADGTNSCWATHTGVQAGTGYTEAQIEANPTGAGFKEVNGDVTITQPGTVIDHQWINGCIAINAGANNVTIKNSLITSNGDTCQSSGSGLATAGGALNAGQDGTSSAPTGTLLQDITVDGGTGEADYGITLPHGECLRCNVFHFDQGILSNSATSANPALFEGDYVHDTMLQQPWESLSNCGHRNGFYMNSSTYVTIDDSYAIMTSYPCVTGAISLQNDYGTPDHITVQNSYGEGVGGMDFTGSCATNTLVRNNAFSNDNGYGGLDFSVRADNPGITWTGNHVAETGASLSPGGGC